MCHYACKSRRTSSWDPTTLLKMWRILRPCWILLEVRYMKSSLQSLNHQISQLKKETNIKQTLMMEWIRRLRMNSKWLHSSRQGKWTKRFLTGLLNYPRLRRKTRLTSMNSKFQRPIKLLSKRNNLPKISKPYLLTRSFSRDNFSSQLCQMRRIWLNNNHSTSRQLRDQRPRTRSKWMKKNHL